MDVRFNRRWSPCLAFAALGGLLLGSGCAYQVKKAPPAPPLQKVLYVTPVQEDVTEFEEFTGRTAPVEMIELRSRVSGNLVDVGFEDGTEVKKGDVLFEIDPRPFEAEAARAAAAIEQYKARVQRYTRQLERGDELLRKKAISQDEYDTYRFDKAEAEASRDAAVAAHDIAKLNLGYAKVSAPISGRISRRLVDPGNLVQADTTPLATIVPLESVYVYFDVDERTVLKLRRLVQDGVIKPTYMTDTTVQIALADAPAFDHQGRVDFEENQIDPATGTLRVRAVVRNDDRFLSPGMFVRIRYPIGQPSPSLLIPEESLGSDQGQPFVYVIGDENKVAYRKVTLGTQVGKRRVIREGIESGERVVVTGLQRIKKNMPVDPELRQDKKAEVVDGSAAADKKLSSTQAPR